MYTHREHGNFIFQTLRELNCVHRIFAQHFFILSTTIII